LPGRAVRPWQTSTPSGQRRTDADQAVGSVAVVVSLVWFVEAEWYVLALIEYTVPLYVSLDPTLLFVVDADAVDVIIK
jgi:hypothetical protein